MKMIRKMIAALLAGACLQAAAQGYPSGAVRIIVPYPAGGGVDVLARELGEQLARVWAKPILVDNRPGASTLIGSEAVVKSKPDGLTLLLTSDSSITSNPHLFEKMSFDPMVDLAPITRLTDVPLIVVVHPSVKANSVQELVAAAKSQPGKMNYGSFGPGSQPNLIFEALRMQTGAPIAHIPYKGIAPAVAATVAGEVEVTLGGMMHQDFFSTGKLKAIAIDRATRLPKFPTLPTLKEGGFENVTARSWFGLFAPRGTPRAVIDKIRDDVAAIINEPRFQARSVVGRGMDPVASTADEFSVFLREDFDAKGKIIKGAGIKLE